VHRVAGSGAAAFAVHSRLTFVTDDAAAASVLSERSSLPDVLKSYDLLAVQPLTERVLHLVWLAQLYDVLDRAVESRQCMLIALSSAGMLDVSRRHHCHRRISAAAVQAQACDVADSNQARCALRGADHMTTFHNSRVAKEPRLRCNRLSNKIAGVLLCNSAGRGDSPHRHCQCSGTSTCSTREGDHHSKWRTRSVPAARTGRHCQLSVSFRPQWQAGQGVHRSLSRCPSKLTVLSRLSCACTGSDWSKLCKCAAACSSTPDAQRGH